MKRFATFALIVVGLMLAFALASCGDDDNGGEQSDATEQTTTPAAEGEAAEQAEGASEGAGEVPAGEADTTVSASLGEYYIKLDKPAADAGNISFEATNDGSIEHELVVIETDTPAGKLPLSGSGVDEEGAGEVPGEIPSVAPGATEQVTLSLKAGKYALICNLPGHYANGQYAEFAVK